MIKFYHPCNAIRLKMESDYVYEEVSSNIYNLTRTWGISHCGYVKAGEVVKSLNSEEKITVFGKDKIYANFELKEA